MSARDPYRPKVPVPLSPVDQQSLWCGVRWAFAIEAGAVAGAWGVMRLAQAIGWWP